MTATTNDAQAGRLPAATPGLSPPGRIWKLLAVLLVAPLAMHLPELLGLISCDLMPEASGLAASPVHHLLRGSCYIDGNAGGTMQALGHLSAESWLSGRLPWWNTYSGVGMPLAAEMQPASFFMPFILLLHFSNGVLFIKIAVQILAGLCMFACLTGLRVSAPASLLGALLWQFNGTFAWFGDAPILPLPFLPLLILGIQRAADRAANQRVGGIAEIAVALAYSLAAGFPETAFINGVLAAIWAILAAFRMNFATIARFGLSLAAGSAIGLALAAPALVPFVDYLGHASVITRAFVRLGQLHYAQISALFLPTLYGPPYRDTNMIGWGQTGGYIGTGTMLAGIAGLIGYRGQVRVRTLALGWSVFWMANFIGEPVSRAIWQAVPLLKDAAVTRYAMPSISFLWAVLAAFGWDSWRQGRAGRSAPIIAAIAVLAAVAAAMSIPRLNWAHWSTACYPCLTLAWVGCLLMGAAFLLREAPGPARRRWLAALLVIDAGGSFALPIATGHGPVTIDRAPLEFVAARNPLARTYGLGEKLVPNYGAYFGLATLQSFSVPTPLLWADYLRTLDPRLLGLIFGDPKLPPQRDMLLSGHAGFERAAVDYVMTDAQDDPLATAHDPNVVPVFQSPTTHIYHLPAAVPYFQITQGGPCTLQPKSRTSVTAICTAPAALVRHELFYPGWRATAGHAKAPITQADPVFQQISLPAGTSRVEFDYTPPHAKLILLLFLGGMAALLALIVPPMLHVFARATPQRPVAAKAV